MGGNFFMSKPLYVTITGTNYCYGMKPFEIGRIFKIVKEKDNEHDQEAVRAELPYIGKIGYVANSPYTVAKGTISAGRLYEQIDEYAYAQVLFVTSTKVICLVLRPEEVEDPFYRENSAEKSEETSLRREIKSTDNAEDNTDRSGKGKCRIGFVR